MGARFRDVNLSAAQFNDINLSNAVFDDVNLTRLIIRNANCSHLAITDACCEGMTIDGILVTDLLRAYQRHRENESDLQPRYAKALAFVS